MATRGTVSHPRVSSGDIPKEELDRIVNSESQLREAQALAAIGSWEWDIKNDRITWSDELYHMYGVDKDSFDTSFDSFMQLIHPDDRELLGSTVQRCMETHESYSIDHRLVRPDGEVRYLHGQGAVVVEDDAPVRLYGIAQDMTDQRLAYKQKLQLEQAEKNAQFRADLLTVVAHELNTPLTPLQLQTHLLMRRAEELPEDVQRAAALIDRNVRRLTLLVADVLDMSRNETGNLTLDRRSFPIMDIVQETADTFEPAAQEKNVHLDLSGVQAFSMDADPYRMTQVLQNLVKNAIKFTPPGGTIAIVADPRDEEGEEDPTPMLSVKDTGRGLTPEKIDRLFEPFAQVHEDQGRGGHGLGLFISKSIVEAHGGSIEVASDGEGMGATFTVRIPPRPKSGA